MHILVIEDDTKIAANIAKMLRDKEYIVTLAHTGEDGLFALETENYDAVVLDWMLPDKNGIQVLTRLRSKNNNVPVIMLTAKSQLEDKVEGFSKGADDYLTKPFALKELLVRIKAVIRRSSNHTQTPLIKIAGLTINTDICEVKRSGKNINLAPKEYALLEYLALNEGKAMDRTSLLHHVWGEDIDPFTNTIDVHIRYLRKKIDDQYKKKLIKTVPGKGYMICK